MAHEIVQGGPSGRPGKTNLRVQTAGHTRAFALGWALAAGTLVGVLCATGTGHGQAPPLAPSTAAPSAGLLALQQPGGAPPAGPPAGPPQPPPPTGTGPRLSDLIGGVHPRLEGLPTGLRAPVGTTPVPDKAALEKERQYVDRFHDPEFTIDVVVGRPRIWVLKRAPFRIQAGDPTVLDYNTIGNARAKSRSSARRSAPPS